MSRKSNNTADQERIAQLEKELAELKAKNNLVDDLDLDIRPDEYIKVMSMLSWTLNLSTGVAGRKPFTFTKLFSTKNILYRELVDILENHPTFAEYGYFYILDRRVVRKHGLDEAYEKILDDKKLQQVLDGGTELSIKVFKTANPKQQKAVANFLISKLVKGEDVDMNLVHIVSQDTGIDINTKARDFSAIPQK